MAHIITFNHTRKSKPIGKVLSVTKINNKTIVVWRRKENNAMKYLKFVLKLIFFYILLATVFNWWPINLLGWPF